MKRPRLYKESDWPKSKRRVAEGEVRKGPPRPRGPTPIEEWIERDKRKENERPFDDELPF